MRHRSHDNAERRGGHHGEPAFAVAHRGRPSGDTAEPRGDSPACRLALHRRHHPQGHPAHGRREPARADLRHRQPLPVHGHASLRAYEPPPTEGRPRPRPHRAGREPSERGPFPVQPAGEPAARNPDERPSDGALRPRHPPPGHHDGDGRHGHRHRQPGHRHSPQPSGSQRASQPRGLHARPRRHDQPGGHGPHRARGPATDHRQRHELAAATRLPRPATGGQPQARREHRQPVDRHTLPLHAQRDPHGSPRMGRPSGRLAQGAGSPPHDGPEECRPDVREPSRREQRLPCWASIAAQLT